MFSRLLLLGVLAASLGFAQRGGGRGGGGGGDDMGGGGGMSMPAMPNKLDRISTELNLNKEQKKAAKTALDEGAKQAIPLRDQLSKSRIAIAEAIRNQKSPEEIQQAESASAAVAAELDQLEMKTFAKIFTGLNDGQRSNRQAVSMVFQMMHGIFRNKNWNED